MSQTKKSKKSRKSTIRRSNPLKTSTPASTHIDIHYAKLDLRKRWDRSRIERLCGFLNISQSELASMIAVRHGSFEGYLKRGIMPGPAALLLTVMESHYLLGKAPDVISNIFNFHGTSGRSKENEYDTGEAS